MAYQIRSENLNQAVLFNMTRWNTIADILKSLLSLQNFCRKHEYVQSLYISDANWMKIESLAEVLSVPALLTTKIQAQELNATDFIFYWFSTIHELKKIISAETTSSLLAKQLLNKLKNQGEAVFKNKIIITAWYLDKNLSLLDEMSKDDEKKRSLKV